MVVGLSWESRMQECTSSRSGRVAPGADDYAFFLGGRDLEMVTIKEMLERELHDDLLHGRTRYLTAPLRAAPQREN